MSELFTPPPSPLLPPWRLLVVGAGPVGHALAAGLENAGCRLRHWSRSRGPLFEETNERAEADVVILAVSDDAIPQAARFVVEHGAAGKSSVLLHCAGSLPPAQAFAAVHDAVGGIGMIHPLRSFAKVVDQNPGDPVPPAEPQPHGFTGTIMAVAGDARGREVAGQLVTALGGKPLSLTDEQLVLYHASAVLAAGHVAALFDVAAHLLRHLGLSRREGELALLGLTRSVLDNIDRVGLPAALTGPFARGDADTVGRHLAALDHLACEAAEVYRALAHTSVDLAARKGVSEESLSRIDAVLRRPASKSS
jgi:predicted short-subunit dehydrogenase-like oxidoreductase (DUF2520 family)